MRTRRALLRRLDGAQVAEAIRRAESGSSGEVVVLVSRFFWGDVERTAQRALVRLGLTATRRRNAVLILIVPSRHRFAVVGDVGVHDAVGVGFWRDVAARLAADFAAERYTDGLVHAIDRIGAALAEHFPPDPEGDVNELADELRTR